MHTTRSAIVTGGSGGIGLAIAQSLAHEGYEVTLIARDAPKLDAAKKNIASTGNVHTAPLDVSDEHAVTAFIGRFKGIHETLDILVNAAGIITPIGPIEEVAPDAWLNLIRINVFGTFLMTRACITLLAKSGHGTVINFLGGGEGALPGFSAYVTSKGAIARFTETAAAELKDKSITVNAIVPGAVNTKMTEDMIAAGERAGGDQYRRALTQKKEKGASPEKAVRLALWLSSEKARGITGKIISAQRDAYEEFPEHSEDIASSDVYTMRRILAKDRGLPWND